MTRSRGMAQTPLHYAVAKRTLDVLLCVAALPIILPVLLLCALLIRLESPGPIVFAQMRTGQHGVRFPMFKFRTMVQNDPRITRVGAFLRKTSLDELPQFLNVLRGEMTIVGPRPTSFAASTYDLWHSERLEVLPGITGLWQIKGRGTMTFDERLRLDIEYIERRSILLDLRLIVLTVFAVFRGSGA